MQNESIPVKQSITLIHIYIFNILIILPKNKLIWVILIKWSLSLFSYQVNYCLKPFNLHFLFSFYLKYKWNARLICWHYLDREPKFPFPFTVCWCYISLVVQSCFKHMFKNKIHLDEEYEFFKSYQCYKFFFTFISF